MAPTESRLRMMALSGTTMDRNTTSSSRKLMPRTKGNTTNAASSAILKKSMLNAVSPVTSTVA